MFFVLQVSVALGCAMRGRTVAFASTFAAYLSRAYDQIRVGAICGSNICLIGSHCGVSVGMSWECVFLVATVPSIAGEDVCVMSLRVLSQV